MLIANSNDTSDLFNNFEIPAFDAGSQNTTTQEVTPSISNDIQPDNNGLYIGITIGVLIVLIIFFKLLKKIKELSTPKELEIIKEEKVEKIPEVKVVEKKPKKSAKSFATPTNLNKCIRQFLDNTKIR